MNDAITTMARHCMMTWLTPTMSALRAAGSSTLRSICRLVQPPITPASRTSGETPRSPSSVSRAIGGMANRIVAMAPGPCG